MANTNKGPGCERNFPRKRATPASRADLRAELDALKPPRDSRYHGVHLAKHVRERVWQATAYGPDTHSHFCGMWSTELAAALARAEPCSTFSMAGHPSSISQTNNSTRPRPPRCGVKPCANER